MSAWASARARRGRRRKGRERTTRLANVGFDANEPARLARFWANALEWAIEDEGAEGARVRATDDTRFDLVFLPVSQPKTAKNPIHLDLVGESVDHQGAVVDRFLLLGAERVDIGQGTDADHVVLADPEGNEFCVVLRGEFLADTGFVGAVVFEPADPVTGYFWADAIGWPVVYDENGDVAIRAPDGRGPFITFGPPGVVEAGTNRLHLELAPDADAEEATEIDRLVALGANRIPTEERDVARVRLADPDGNTFSLLTSR